MRKLMMTVVMLLGLVSLSVQAADMPGPQPSGPGAQQQPPKTDSGKDINNTPKAGNKGNKATKTDPKGLQVEPVDFKSTDPKGLEVEPVNF